jgi:hypothetical protein
MSGLTSIPNPAVLQPRQPGALSPRPLVSVLVANYNYAGFIGQTIESVLGQTYDHWELIICDDGSTDNSVPVIEEFVKRDPRIRLIRKSNGGHASALNEAYAACQGEIVCLLDSDDLYLPTKLQRVVETCLANPDAGLIVHRVIRVDEQRHRQGVWPLSNPPDGWFGARLLGESGVLHYLPPTSGLSLRRAITEGLFPVSLQAPLHMCPDQVIMRLAPLIARVAGIPEPLAEYRLHSANTYSRRQISAESVGRELELAGALWKEQYRFLSLLSPGLEQQLAGTGNSPYMCQLAYLQARLRGSADARRLHAAYMAVCERQNERKWRRFWRASIYLPDPLFRRAINLLLGQSALKQFVARLKRLY